MKRVCFPDRAKSAIRFGALHRESLPFLDSSKKLKKLWGRMSWPLFVHVVEQRLP
jgi:hypothetical protein